MKKLLMLAVMMMIAGSAFASGGTGFGTRSKCSDWSWQCAGPAWNACRRISTDVNSTVYKDCARPIVESCMASMSCDAKKSFPYLYN